MLKKTASTLLKCEQAMIADCGRTQQILLNTAEGELETTELRLRAQMGAGSAIKVSQGWPPIVDVTSIKPNFVVQELRLQLMGASKYGSPSEQLFAVVCARAHLRQLAGNGSEASMSTTSTDSTTCPTLKPLETIMSASSDLGSTNTQVVLLAFTRHSKYFHNAVLKTPLAKSCQQHYDNVRPPWAHGATILVHGFGQGDAEEFRAVFAQQPRLGPNHVVLLEKDEDSFMECFHKSMKRLHQRNRVTLKPLHGRLVLDSYSPYLPSRLPSRLPLSDVWSAPTNDLAMELNIPGEELGDHEPTIECSNTGQCTESGKLPSYTVIVDRFQRLVPVENAE